MSPSPALVSVSKGMLVLTGWVRPTRPMARQSKLTASDQLRSWAGRGAEREMERVALETGRDVAGAGGTRTGETASAGEVGMSYGISNV